MTAIKTPQKRTRSLSAAKSQFTTAVAQGIEELMQNLGYSRKRATATLLRELGRGGETPCDNEIFHLMELQGLGMEDAAKALVVSKAVRRAMKDGGVSAIEAIDDLTSRLSVANLMIATSPAANADRQDDNNLVQQRNSTRKIVSTSAAQPLHSRKLAARKSLVKKQIKGSTAALKTSRKRSSSEETKDNPKIARARADSVAEEVNAKFAETRSVKRKDGPPPVAPSSSVKRPKV